MTLHVSDEHWDTSFGQHLHLISNSGQVPYRCLCLGPRGSQCS